MLLEAANDQLAPPGASYRYDMSYGVGLLKSLMQDAIAVLTGHREPLPEAATMAVLEQVMMYGLEFETVDVTTEDGYINEMWHIWSKEALDTTKEPIFFLHGVIDTAGTWLFNEPEKAPAVILAQQGYDCWLGNSRGQFYSH